MTKPSYYMTLSHHSMRGYWETCNATTLSGAKREAWARFGGDLIGATVIVARGDDVGEPRQRLAARTIASGNSTWRDL